ncbi:amidohydrolase [Niastella yeongjuensis]|uniref:Amidohydrolase n=1 Tax=Niastella yeongjuensis TaxID=354355 RepID=A0A1V9EWB2_9BACT|nr:nitrilase family protein [Niastella yeongjuensis]OQP50436.1 amidohydrolase [Niastella yeongjuensis]SEN34562.1 Carbon-nitrogen hydrolase [Niastella yeongjuensis]
MSTLTITTIQSNLHWEDKAANLQQFEAKIRELQQRTEVVILPEMFSTGFSMNAEKLAEKMDGPTVTWMKKLSAERKIILTGSLIIEEAGNYYNRLIWMLPNGQYGYYDKRHLFAYAQEDQHYSAGNKRLIASVKGWRINLLVCYDLRFPVWSRQKPAASSLADLVASELEARDLPMPPPEEAGSSIMDTAPEYDVLIYVANWPERRNHAWKTLLQARAIENQCYVVGVNRVGTDGLGHYYSGDSMVIDAMGAPVYTKAHDEDIFTITLQKDSLEEVRNKLPFLKDADRFILA